MRKFFHNAVTVLKEMNNASKKLIRYGSILIILTYIASLFLYIGAGRFLDYYTASLILADLLVLGKELIGVIFVPALLIELIYTSSGKKTEHAEDKK